MYAFVPKIMPRSDVPSIQAIADIPQTLLEACPGAMGRRESWSGTVWSGTKR